MIKTDRVCRIAEQFTFEQSPKRRKHFLNANLKFKNINSEEK